MPLQGTFYCISIYKYCQKHAKQFETKIRIFLLLFHDYWLIFQNIGKKSKTDLFVCSSPPPFEPVSL